MTAIYDEPEMLKFEWVRSLSMYPTESKSVPDLAATLLHTYPNDLKPYVR
jgi:hypothetical protein